jgi:homoserine/homoserine lactone efflux protein
MNLELYVTFVVSSIVLVLSPGPVNVTVMAHATTHGWLPAMTTNAGACLSIAVQLALTALGVGWLLLLLDGMFDVIRWIGAACIIYLGIAQWRAAEDGTGAARSTDYGSLFWQGLLVSSTNPKSLLLFPALFPQFVDHTRPALLQLAVLAVTFEAISIVGFAALAGVAHQMQPLFRSPTGARIRNRIFGGALVILGVGMIIGP